LLDPIRARREELEKDIPAVWDILRRGTDAAVAEAQITLNAVRKAMRIDYFDDPELTGRAK
ncbi:MAG: tryptophan--tRNA ligase, partial [Bacteroidales bacterium]|nr:tryptophan--tRNA ligase [Bacteroidales bacterium]